MTGLDVLERRIAPPVRPANPPTMLFAPLLMTGPEEVEKIIAPGLSLLSEPTNPPSMLLPSLLPASPPAILPAPTLTLPVAWPSMISAVLTKAEPSPLGQPLQLKLLKIELEATSPPATLAPPACTS